MKKFLVIFVVFFTGTFFIASAQAESIAQRLAGKILLQVQEHGEAWYIHPENLERYYLKDGEAAYTLMRFFSLGITDANLAKIPAVADTSAMLDSTTICSSNSLADQVKGRILLQVQQNGEAWYVDTKKCRRVYMKDGAAAYEMMRFLGLGITNKDLQGVPTSPDSAKPNGVAQPETTLPQLNDGQDSLRSSFLNAVNVERSLVGQPSSKLVRSLSEAAQAQADDMTNRNYFDSKTPEGKSFADWVTEAGYAAQSLSENLAQSNQGITTLISNWGNQSPNSYANLIEPKFTDLGVGIGSFQGIPTYVIIFAESREDFFYQQVASLGDLNQVRNEMLLSLNAERAKVGAAPLVMNQLLQNSVQGHTDDMLARSFYAHETPEGKTPHQRITEAGYSAQKSAENIAKGQFSVVEVMEDWMNSEGHRINILDFDFQEVGFGLSFGENNNGFEVIWGQNFGKRL